MDELDKIPAVLTQEWREAHAVDGDEAIGEARRLCKRGGSASYELARTWAAIAQAHYAAANVRAKPLAKASDAYSQFAGY